MTNTPETTPASVAFPMIDEEIGVLAYLCGGPETLTFVGARAPASIEDPEFDTGLRSLIAKSMVRLDGEAVLLSAGARQLGSCLIASDRVGLLAVTTDAAHDVMTLGSVDGHVAMVRAKAAGAYEVLFWQAELADAVMTIAADLATPDVDAEWSAGLRLDLSTAEPVDFVVGAGRWGTVTDGVPVETSVEDVRRQVVLAST